MSRSSHAALACAIALGAVSGSALAQDAYPAKPVRMIAPFPPGGSTDVMAKLLKAAGIEPH